jgi:hypothetical protein
LPLFAPSSSVILGLYTSLISLGYEPAMSLGFPQNAAHLHRPLKTVQQRILGFTFTY